MSGVNKVILIGRLGQDPEVRAIPNGDQVANITMATSEKWKDKNTGQEREETEWHRVVFFRRLAEVVGQYLQKGSMVYIEGKLKTRKWQDQSGADRYSTEIVADKLEMLSSRSDNPQGHQSAPQQNNPQPQRNAPQQSYQQGQQTDQQDYNQRQQNPSNNPDGSAKTPQQIQQQQSQQQVAQFDDDIPF